MLGLLTYPRRGVVEAPETPETPGMLLKQELVLVQLGQASQDD